MIVSCIDRVGIADRIGSGSQDDNLLPVLSVTSLRCAIGAVKAAGKAFRTNLFLKDHELETAIQAGSLSAFESDGALVLLKREPHFDRLYYAVGDPEVLEAALVGTPLSEDGVLVADVVGPENEVLGTRSAFESTGFVRQTCLHRLQTVAPQPITSTEADSSVETARADDAAEILQALSENFDLYCDQIPTIEELQKVIARGTILVLRASRGVAGLLFYDLSGMTTLCRYWLVLPDFRGFGIGLRVMHRYFQNCAGYRRFLVWVKEENEYAYKLYRSLGYKPDSIVDMIWMKKG